MKRAFFFCAALLAAPSVAHAADYVLAIGYNGVPPEAGDNPRAALAYADDDAAAFFSFATSIGSEGLLLSVFDAATAARYPALVDRVRPPTHAELRRAVAELRARVLADQRAGLHPVVTVFYSGHGYLNGEGAASLALAQGALTQRVLYDDVFAALPAEAVHLFVDACHAEAVVRPRDVTAQVVDVSPADRLAAAARSTLSRFPHVGAVIASAADAESHEWDLYGNGIFTHQLLSGLRGGADVNGDQRIEYSEMAAFLSAANREVLDPRARLKAVVFPPRLDPRAPLVDLATARAVGRLRGQLAGLGAVHFEDERGNRLADLRCEAGFPIGLVLPPDEPIYLRAGAQEAVLRLRAGETQQLGQLAFGPASTRARGAVDRMLRRGLFAAAFGPAYYRGFVDQTDFVPVSFPTLVERPSSVPPPASMGTARWISFASAAALGVAAGGFGLGAYEARQDFDHAVYQRDSALARDRYQTRGNIALGLAAGAVVSAAVGFLLGWSQ